jgi:hypothetical protein
MHPFAKTHNHYGHGCALCAVVLALSLIGGPLTRVEAQTPGDAPDCADEAQRLPPMSQASVRQGRLEPGHTTCFREDIAVDQDVSFEFEELMNAAAEGGVAGGGGR